MKLKIKYKLDYDEKDVSFKGIQSKIYSRQSSNLINEYNKIRRSLAFTNTEKYRNCATHRRQIFIEELYLKTSHTRGYVSATSPMEYITRKICDDPLSIKPSCRQLRDLHKYLRKTKDALLDNISGLLTKVEFIK